VKIDIGDGNDNKKNEEDKCVIQETEETKKEKELAQKRIDEIMKDLEKIKRDDYDMNKIVPEEFEKDHDENGHIDFIHAGTNLRARNYNIDECDRNKTKKIAGKIIPTILTTTATIAGIASLQVYTTFQTSENKYFRECIFNFNTNYFNFSPPHKAIKTLDKELDPINRCPIKAIPEGWTSWDRIEVKGSKTCGELCEYLKEKYQIIVDTIFIDNIMIYDTFLAIKKNKDLKIEDVYAESMGKQICDKKMFLLIDVAAFIPVTKINGKDYENVKVLSPLIKYIFKEK
jgi:ubiquitin-activating enzyme E1